MFEKIFYHCLISHQTTPLILRVYFSCKTKWNSDKDKIWEKWFELRIQQLILRVKI